MQAAYLYIDICLHGWLVTVQHQCYPATVVGRAAAVVPGAAVEPAGRGRGCPTCTYRHEDKLMDRGQVYRAVREGMLMIMPGCGIKPARKVGPCHLPTHAAKVPLYTAMKGVNSAGE